MPMNKTCGTCGHGTQKVVACDDSGLYPTERKACDKWIECTDSLEQVLNDAIEGCDELRGMFNNMNGNGLLQYGDYSQLFEQLCYINERIETARLRALGVEVPQ